MCVYVCVSTRVYVHAHMCMYVCIFTSISVSVCYLYVCGCNHTFEYVCMYECEWCVCVLFRIHVHHSGLSKKHKKTR